MPEPKDRLRKAGIVLLLFIGIYIAGVQASQSDIWLIYSGYGIAYLGYLLLYCRRPRLTIAYVLLAGVALRLTLLWQMPQLSDDIYRFVWDGRLWHHGVSPYAHLPTALVDSDLEGIDRELLALLNSPDYYSIYPPASQLLYYLCSWPSWSIANTTMVLRCLHILIELAGAYYLWRLCSVSKGRQPSEAVWLTALYYLSPLVMVEGVGNLHHEPLTMTCVIASLYYWSQRRQVVAALYLGIGIGIKLIPLLLVPYLLLQSKGKERQRYLATLVLVLSCMSLPLLWSLDVAHFLGSVDLYFRRFEFNASIYYLLRYLGRAATGYNLIAYLGPLLALVPVIYACRLAWRERSRQVDVAAIARYGLLTLTLYYLCATTVHPWYIINLIPLALVAGYRYPLVWSALIPLTYINYSSIPYHEVLPIVAIEYGLLAVAIYYEVAYRQNSNQPAAS